MQLQLTRYTAIYNNANRTDFISPTLTSAADYYAVGFRKEDKETTKKFQRGTGRRLSTMDRLRRSARSGSEQIW